MRLFMCNDVTRIDSRSMSTSRLLNHWTAIPAGNQVAHANWYTTVVTAYQEPQRYYHTLRHLERMLELLETYEQDLEDVNVVRLAVFFHEYVWDGEQDGIMSFDIFCIYNFEISKKKTI